MEEMCKTGLQQITSEKEEGMEEKRKGTDTHPAWNLLQLFSRGCVYGSSWKQSKEQSEDTERKKQEGTESAISHHSLINDQNQFEFMIWGLIYEISYDLS